MFAREKLTFEALALPDRAKLNDEQMRQAARAFYETMRTRHSIRDFAPTEVPQEIIENCIRTAGSAPSGANHQPWHFVAIRNPDVKAEIRKAAEKEEEAFYAGGGGDEWIKALEPIGTGPEKPHLEIAPWLIVIFAQRYGEFDDGTKYKNYYVNESVGIATGFLIAALHHAGLSTLTHTPNPMKFLNELLQRPKSEKPVMILAIGHAAEHATVPAVAKIKKPLKEILTVL
jgi:nitroreductase